MNPLLCLRRTCVLSVCFAVSLVGELRAAEPILKPNDCVALVGGTIVERPAFATYAEYEMQTRQPQWKLKVRNLGWAGDDVHGFARKVFETDPNKGLQRLIQDLKIAKPSVVLLAYGFAEASDPKQTAQSFRAGLENLLVQVEQIGARPVLMQPFALPGVKLKDYSQRMDSCVQVISDVASQKSVPLVKVTCDQFTADGLSPSVQGYQLIGKQLADQLVGGQSVTSDHEALYECINEKNELFFHRHRPQNETYLLLFRKHEQGNNAVELPAFDPLVDSLDQRIWGLAQPR